MADYTVAALEAILLRRCSAAMGVVSLDVTTQDGTNADLKDPIHYAAGMVGLCLADPTTVADADLTPLTYRPSRALKLLDLAERRTLETVVNLYLYVDHKTDRDAHSKDQFRQGLRARIDELTARIAQPYNTRRATMPIGRYEPRLSFRWGTVDGDGDGDAT